jgi:hypothetical protein
MLSKIKEACNFQVIFKTHLQTNNTWVVIISHHRILISPIIFNPLIRVKINLDKIINNKFLIKTNLLAFLIISNKTKRIVIFSSQDNRNKIYLAKSLVNRIISRIMYFKVIKLNRICNL